MNAICVTSITVHLKPTIDQTNPTCLQSPWRLGRLDLQVTSQIEGSPRRFQSGQFLGDDPLMQGQSSGKPNNATELLLHCSTVRVKFYQFPGVVSWFVIIFLTCGCSINSDFIHKWIHMLLNWHQRRRHGLWLWRDTTRRIILSQWLKHDMT